MIAQLTDHQALTCNHQRASKCNKYRLHFVECRRSPYHNTRPEKCKITPMSSPAGRNDGSNNGRGTTLPPIRDLFPEELSRTPRPMSRPSVTSSPSSSFAGLSLNDHTGGSNREHTRSNATFNTRIFDTTNERYAPAMSRGSSYTSSSRVMDSGTQPYHLEGHSRQGSRGLSFDQRSAATLPSINAPPYYSSPSSQNRQWIQSRERHGSDSRDYYSSTNGANYALPVSNVAPASSNARYECEYCGKGFNRPSSLKIHINSHTGERPFVCPHEGCGRSFTVLSNMRRHARVHLAPSTAASSREGYSSGSDGSPRGSPAPHPQR